jgi:hypothetical protein
MQLAAQEAEAAIVMPVLPGDPRERATRIGGQFGPRIGEALDAGLDASTILPLLDRLDPPAAKQPLAPVPAATQALGARAVRQRGVRIPADAMGGDLQAAAMVEPITTATVAVAIGSVIVGEILSSSDTDINYQTDSYRGWKRPLHIAAGTPIGTVTESEITVAWDDDALIDAIGMKLDIRWQHDRWSLGNVHMVAHGFNDAFGDSLFVRAEISEDDTPFHGTMPYEIPVYANRPGAKLRVTISYRRGRMIRGDVVHEKVITLLPNGGYTQTDRAR